MVCILGHAFKIATLHLAPFNRDYNDDVDLLQAAKKKAAESMIEKLKTLPPVASCHVPPKKKASTTEKNKNKQKAKALVKIETLANPDYGQSINPISRLIQIQQAKKEKEPEYTLIEERGMPRRREFVMKVRRAETQKHVFFTHTNVAILLSSVNKRDGKHRRRQ